MTVFSGVGRAEMEAADELGFWWLVVTFLAGQATGANCRMRLALLRPAQGLGFWKGGARGA